MTIISRTVLATALLASLAANAQAEEANNRLMIVNAADDGAGRSFGSIAIAALCGKFMRS